MPIVAIGNGLFARTRPAPESMLAAYLRKQRECHHSKRDPKGMCYDCGHRRESESDLENARRERKGGGA